MSLRRRAVSDEVVIATYRELGSGRKAAAAVGLSVPTVYSVLAQHQIPRHQHNPAYDRRKQRVTDEQIVDAYRRLGNGEKAAKELGVTGATVYDALKRSGVRTRGSERIRAFDPEMVKTIAKRYAEGLSIANIAREVRASAPTVWKYLRDAGVDTARRTRLTLAQQSMIRDRYAAGEFLYAIAAEVGAQETTVRRFLRKSCGDLWEEGADRSGPRATNWKGGRVVHRGYVYLKLPKDDPFIEMADASRYALEHRLVMARKLGRPLTRSETVHHINGDKSDNRPENLQLRQGRHGKHVVIICRDCGSHNVGPAPLA